MYLKKGDRITAEVFTQTDGVVAGVQAKIVAQKIDITGTVTHIRGDDPNNPRSIRVCINDGTQNYWVDPASIVAIY